MGYLHIPNLYKDQLILAMRECYALEKLHGTSADIVWKCNPSNKEQRQLIFHSGGESHSKFVSLFDVDILKQKLTDLGLDPDKDLTIYGEAYGGSCQKMSETYGPRLKFIVFDIQIGDCWLDVPKAEEFVKQLGLEFVHYVKCSLVKSSAQMKSGGESDYAEWIVETNLKEIDAERDAPSMQAVRNGVSTPEAFMKGEGPKREGVVLRPLFEIRLNDHEEAGHRLIAKHKGDDFRETASPRVVDDPAKLATLNDANSVANEWAVATRLDHVLQKLPKPHDMSLIPKLIPAMVEDVLREGAGEIVDSEPVRKSIGKKTVELYKSLLKSRIGQNNFA